MSVSVVVPLYNGRDLVADCLRSIPDSCEVIVVDDCSSDGAPDVVRGSFPDVALVRNESNIGFGATANRGLTAAHGEIRIVLNSDARFQRGAVELLVEAFRDGDVGIAGPRLVFGDGSHQISAANFTTPARIVAGSFLLGEVVARLLPGARFPFAHGLPERDHHEARDVDWVSGACLAISARCLEDVGGFDEGYVMYAEEIDLCWRVKKAGWRVRFVAEARVVHLGGGSTGDPRKNARMTVRSEARFMARAYGRGVIRRWRCARVAGALVKIPALAIAALASRRARNRLLWQWNALFAALGSEWADQPPTRLPGGVSAGDGTAEPAATLAPWRRASRHFPAWRAESRVRR